MDRRTYKALRRCIWSQKIDEIMQGLYGLRMRQDEEVALQDLFDSEPEIDVELEDED